MKTLLVLAAAASLAACAVQPQPTPTAGTSATPDKPGESSLTATPSTGSRLANKGQDRTVRQIGNQTFKNDEASNIRSIGNDVGARSN